MISCPHCALENPDGAQRCDCGWDFTTSRMQQSLLPTNDPSIKQKAPKWMIFLGISVYLIAQLLRFFIKLKH
jgi:hypothetical protein